jgi:hypothetical protein
MSEIIGIGIPNPRPCTYTPRPAGISDAEWMSFVEAVEKAAEEQAIAEDKTASK